MKKKVVTHVVVCDYCEEPAEEKCSLCGKDVCNACARWICKKTKSPRSSGGPSLFPSWGEAMAGYPWTWKAERTLCKDCTEKFKVAIGVLVGNEKKEVAH